MSRLEADSHFKGKWVEIKNNWRLLHTHKKLIFFFKYNDSKSILVPFLTTGFQNKINFADQNSNNKQWTYSASEKKMLFNEVIQAKEWSFTTIRWKRRRKNKILGASDSSTCRRCRRSVVRDADDVVVVGTGPPPVLPSLWLVSLFSGSRGVLVPLLQRFERLLAVIHELLTWKWSHQLILDVVF